MSKVIIIKHDDDRIGLYKPTPIEYEFFNQTENEFLLNLTATYNNEGITTCGIIDEDDVPTAPTGGNQNHLIWDGSALAYNTSAIAEEKRVTLKNQVEEIFTKKDEAIQITIDDVLFTNSTKLKQNLNLFVDVVANGGDIPTGAKIRQSDGIRVSLTSQLYLNLSNELALAHSDLFNALEDHLDMIEITNDTELDYYDVDIGWGS